MLADTTRSCYAAKTPISSFKYFFRVKEEFFSQISYLFVSPGASLSFLSTIFKTSCISESIELF